MLGTAFAAAVVLSVPDASAKTSYDSRYGFERTWNAALRLVRVDLGFKVIEKDDANGYLLFEYRSPESGSKPSSGSMEFIRSKEDVRVVVQLPQMPRYHEQVLLDGLVRKMRDEYGEPPPPKKDVPPPPPSDAGADGSTSEKHHED
jgi:hypothetical protein